MKPVNFSLSLPLSVSRARAVFFMRKKKVMFGIHNDVVEVEQKGDFVFLFLVLSSLSSSMRLRLLVVLFSSSSFFFFFYRDKFFPLFSSFPCCRFDLNKNRVSRLSPLFFFYVRYSTTFLLLRRILLSYYFDILIKQTTRSTPLTSFPSC